MKDVQHSHRSFEPIAELATQTATEINKCTSRCEVFINQRLSVRVLKSLFWMKEFLKYVSAFDEKRDRLQRAIQLYTARGTKHLVESARETNQRYVTILPLSYNHADAFVSHRLEVIERLIKEQMPPAEREMAKKASNLGLYGDLTSAMQKTSALAELNRFENEINNNGNQGVSSHFSYYEMIEALETSFQEDYEPNPDTIDFPSAEDLTIASSGKKPGYRLGLFNRMRKSKNIHHHIYNPVGYSFRHQDDPC